MALAELARRGLLLPSRLPSVVPPVALALSYDVRKGPHSVGAHVRDAAAFVCWAFARAYAADIMRPHAAVLAPALLTVAVFDREVNCRRAASAAFQECVGRLGAETFPHGIEIVTAADYYAVGPRPAAYLGVARQVARFRPYTRPLVEHLLTVKMRHWCVRVCGGGVEGACMHGRTTRMDVKRGASLPPSRAFCAVPSALLS